MQFLLVGQKKFFFAPWRKVPFYVTDHAMSALITS